MRSRSRQWNANSAAEAGAPARRVDEPQGAADRQTRRGLDGLPPLRMLRFAAVRERTGLSRSTIWRLEQSGSFPRHRRISPNAVAWREDEVVEWIESKCGE